jgi:hypothetical protein
LLYQSLIGRDAVFFLPGIRPKPTTAFHRDIKLAPWHARGGWQLRMPHGPLISLLAELGTTRSGY